MIYPTNPPQYWSEKASPIADVPEDTEPANTLEVKQLCNMLARYAYSLSNCNHLELSYRMTQVIALLDAGINILLEIPVETVIESYEVTARDASLATPVADMLENTAEVFTTSYNLEMALRTIATDGCTCEDGNKCSTIEPRCNGMLALQALQSQINKE